jgi:cardiolipin synthase (CMP-forming)
MKKNSNLSDLIFSDKRWLTISNVMTLARFVLTPLVVISLAYQEWMLAVFLFAIAAGTDLLDGHLARVRNEQTNLGTLLDPLADKFLLLASFGALAFLHTMPFSIPHWFFLIALGREALMLCGATVLLLCYKGARVRPLIWGKITTLMQILFLLWILVCYFAGWEPKRTYKFLLVALAIFSLISLWKYVRYALREIRSLPR